MTQWIRFAEDGVPGFGRLDGTTISVCSGDMFGSPAPTGRTLGLDAVVVLTPTAAGKMIALWNNFRALAAKLGNPVPSEPLYFIKGNSSYLPTGETIRTPKSYRGKVVYEGELGIVIGRTCRGVSEAEAQRNIFGYTCINDVTAADILHRDSTFAQWTRAKSFDTFGVFGPVVATGLDPMRLSIRTVLDGQERQNYPVSDMVFPPATLVSLISQDLTLDPGDVIACGTSVGVGSMKPGSTVEVAIDGIGVLVNRFE
ncbi:MAG: fumarylacetoacetate hydrolase family protein [Burkholderiales bacterium]|nr:fumarylacetoacetate hydrolase family protein [Burkholderiales bacterium]